MHQTTLHCHLTLVTLLLLLHLPSSTAEIKNITISSDSRHAIRLEEFGFTTTGHLSITLSSISFTSTTTPLNLSLLAFFLSPIDLHRDILDIEKNPKLCILQNPHINLLFNFHNISLSPTSSFNQNFPITKPNGYDLFFSNCNPQTSISMLVHIEFFNFDSNGNKDYLSSGQTQLPTVYFISSLLYFPLLVLWLFTCFKNKSFIHKIHFLMTTLLLFKTLNMICAAENKQYVKITGTPHGWDVLFYTFQSTRALLLFTVLTLIGSGWSVVKPCLEEMEILLLMIGILLQVLSNIAWIVINNTGPFLEGWVIWVWVFLLIDITTCFMASLPMAWRINTLKQTAMEDGKAALNLTKLRLFRDFYMVFFVYVYVSRSLVFAIRMNAPYEFQWMSNVTEESASFVLYVVMFYWFRPMEESEYCGVDEEEEEAALVAIHSGEFNIGSPMFILATV
ncbi:hypothetical protein CsSME_00021814 [Camellia sinensis var. sinensis]